MKLNWGTGIVFTLIAFAALMSFMVYMAVQQDFNLVSEDYYGEELQFQKVIDGKRAALTLSDKATLMHSPDGIYLQLPTDFAGKEKSFSVVMYHALVAKHDFTFAEEKSNKNKFKIPFNTMVNGRWTAKVTLVCDGVSYYFEPEINL